MNVQGFNDVRQTKICIAGLLVSGPSLFEVETATEKLRRYKSTRY